jgi:hypothetical protein
MKDRREHVWLTRIPGIAREQSDTSPVTLIVGVIIVIEWM